MKFRKISIVFFTSCLMFFGVKNINGEAAFLKQLQGVFNFRNNILQVSPKHNEDYIRLDWNFDTQQPYTYKAYKKTNNNGEFQSISMINIDKKEKIKVLNIYPTANIGNKTEESFDLAGKQECKSAMLKSWVSDYGLDLIHIDSINLEDFQSNPDKWLKDSNNNYLYDTIVVGFWNLNPNSHHLNNVGVEAIREFIHSGRGVLAGHHHIGLWNLNGGLNKLKSEFGVKFVAEKGYTDINGNISDPEKNNIDYELPEQSLSSSSSLYWHASTEVVAAKKGALLNFPHNIATEGLILNVPYSHNANEFPTGDVWLEYYNASAHNKNSKPKNITELPDGTNGTKSAYLSTYNNTAIIQTGHESNSNNQLNASEDEKKILVNTIFYLSQLSTTNYLNDMSGQDINAPEEPIINSSDIDVNNKKFIFNLKNIDDIATMYSYYIEATGQNDGVVKTSNVVETEIKSGFKGYSYIIDTKENTEPDNIVDTDKNVIEFNFNKLTSNKYYLHIKSIDNAGNSSDTLHYEIGDTELPKIELTISNKDFTNGEISILGQASDNLKVDFIMLPNGDKIYSENVNYSVTEDGEYEFIVYDIFGNYTCNVISVSNIDRYKPSININKNDDWTNNPIEIHINTKD